MYPTQLPPPITPLADLLALSVSAVPGGGAWPDFSSSTSSSSSSSSSSSLSKRRLKRKQRSRGHMEPVEVITLT